jgi:N-acetylated-alpha-linked acidic dipeptidase
MSMRVLLLIAAAAMAAMQAAPTSTRLDSTRQTGVATNLQVPDAPAFARDAMDLVSSADLSRWHDLLCVEPHVAGTPGDVRQVERLRQAFESMGLTAHVEGFKCLLSRPVSAQLEIVDERPGAGEALPQGRRGVVPLPIDERNLLEDPATAHPDLSWGWNAFSGSGDVTAPVVYANYATREDFATLASLGVQVEGKVVLARYGRCFRGYKARFAQEAGAAGLILYSDPADVGFTRGKVWPEGGGWANDTCIQRGTLNTLPYPGDPGTPGIYASENVLREAPEQLDLPRIPVQPVGYAAASAILARFQGPDAPDAWRGGLPMPYRLTMAQGCEVRLQVQQERFIGSSANVIATIPGAVHPERFVILGCHHDAWGLGAADPGAGTICLLEAARCFAALAERGIRPASTLVFAAWGAEEFGIIGSTEWVEGHAAELQRSGALYINLDMAAMGPNPSLALSPELGGMVSRAISQVPSAAAPGETVLQSLQRQAGDRPVFGALGGGSDHIGFVCRVGVPSVAISAHGAPGTSYHSNYDTVQWYRSIVGQDYASAAMVTRSAIAVAAAMSQPRFPAWRMQDLVRGISVHLDALMARADESQRRQMAVLQPGLQELLVRAERIDAAIPLATSLNEQNATRVERGLRNAVLAFVDEQGLDGRPWFRSLVAASHRDDGYAACMLPLLTEAIMDQDAERLQRAVERMEKAQQRCGNALRLIEVGLGLPLGSS